MRARFCYVISSSRSGWIDVLKRRRQGTSFRQWTIENGLGECRFFWVELSRFFGVYCFNRCRFRTIMNRGHVMPGVGVTLSKFSLLRSRYVGCGQCNVDYLISSVHGGCLKKLCTFTELILKSRSSCGSEQIGYDGKIGQVQKHIFCRVSCAWLKDNSIYVLHYSGTSVRAGFTFMDLNHDCLSMVDSVLRSLSTLGVENARLNYLFNCTTSFSMYGVNRSTRQLSLLTDFITRQGIVVCMTGKECMTTSSQLHRMTFENANYISHQMAVATFYERVLSPSSRIIKGALVGAETSS